MTASLYAIQREDRVDIFGTTVGQFSLHLTTSPNGVRLIDFAEARKIVVCSIRLQHVAIHIATWLSPDRSTRTKIDYIVIDRSLFANVLDMGTFRGPNMNSEHFLVAARLRLRKSASRAVPPSSQRKLVFKKLRS